MRILLVVALLGSALFETHQVAGQTDASAVTPPNQSNPHPIQKGQAEVAGDNKTSRFNIPIKTSGGTQVWTDHAYRDGYRIQENSLTGHWRLLDENNVRRAWGTREQCIESLETIKPKQPAPAKPMHVAVLLHGLMRTNHSMKPLEKSLEAAGIDDTIRFSYASTRSSIGAHAEALREILEDQPTNAHFSFAGHSMGNIVVRHLIGDLERDNDPKNILPRCHAMVMLGPPNQGASISRRLAPTGLYGIVTGKGGMELGPEWDEFVKKLATPPFPFMIVAGDVSENKIQNPLVEGYGDFVVSLDEAKLDGCEKFETVPVLHSFLMSDPKAIELTLAFIKAHSEK